MYRLSDGLDIGGVFDRLDESMLLLGAPGAGKTTQLLDLAAALVDRARGDDEATVPVLLDLAAWSRRRWSPLDWWRGGDWQPRSLTDWLVAELGARYGIPSAIGRAWLREGRLILLLDGLDEVSESFRERCVHEINAIPGRLVVCSREADYDALAARLSLQGALVIRPLSREEASSYLAARRSRPAGDPVDDVGELLTSPLMVNVLLIADDVPSPVEADPVVWRRRLLDAYVWKS